jgi:hypothetical protein
MSLRALGYVGTKAKTYIAQRDVAGRTVRVTLGRHGMVTAHQARVEAQQAINIMRQAVIRLVLGIAGCRASIR